MVLLFFSCLSFPFMFFFFPVYYIGKILINVVVELSLPRTWFICVILWPIFLYAGSKAVYTKIYTRMYLFTTMSKKRNTKFYEGFCSNIENLWSNASKSEIVILICLAWKWLTPLSIFITTSCTHRPLLVLFMLKS